MRRYLYSMIIVMVAIGLGACTPPKTPSLDVVTPTPPILENTPLQTNTDESLESFSSDQLGLCFSYPIGYTLLPESNTVEIVAPALPDSDLRALFWLEISDAADRTAEGIADQELAAANGIRVDRWNITIGGEQAVVLDGMPGQDLQRRVYVVHHKTLYILAFMPTQSATSAVKDQMEALYTTITNSWEWSPCSAVE